METKTFDCVDMKHRAQRKLRAEFEARRNEFGSYSEFLAATLKDDAWARRVWEKADSRRQAPKKP